MAILIALSLILAVSSATPMWPDCSNVSTNFGVPTAGGSFESIGCKFPSPFVNITFPEVLPIGTMASVLVSGGLVGPGNNTGLGLVGPSFEAAALMGPLLITVSNMTFGHEAVLRFTGALPPSSTLAIRSNSFTHSTFNSNAGTAGLMIVAINLGDAHLPITLSRGSQLVVALNTFQANVSAPYAAVNLGFSMGFGNVNVTDGSSLNITENTVTNSVVYGTVQCFAVVNWGVAGSASITAPLSVSKGSAVFISGNGISQFTLFGNVVFTLNPVYTSINVASINFVPDAQSVPLSVSTDSTMTASDNFITYASFSGPAFDVYGYLFTVNVLNVMFNQGSGIAVSSRSTVAFNNNVLSHCTAPTAALSVVQLSFYQPSGGASFSNSSSLITDGNTVVNTTFSSLVVVSVSFGISSNLVLLDGSRASSDNNSVFNSSCLLSEIGQTQLVYWSINALIVADGSSLSLSSNSLRNVATQVFSGASLFATADISGLNGSSLAISNNNMWNVTVTSSNTAVVVSVTLSPSNLNLTDGSTLEIHGNGISCSNVSGDYYSAQLSTGNVHMQLSDRSTISLKSNFAKASVFGSSVYIAFYSVASESPGQVVSDSSIQMSANLIESSQVGEILIVCYWGSSSVSFTVNSSHINFNDNSLINTTISSIACVVQVNGADLLLAQNSTMNVLRSTVNGAKAIQLLLTYISMPNGFTVDAGSFVNVNSNIVANSSSIVSYSLSSLVALLSLNSISLSGTLSVENNTVWAMTMEHFQLITADSFSAVGTSSVVLTCKNTLSWDSNGCNYPKPYLVPALLASSAKLCVPPSNPSNVALIAEVVVGVLVGVLLIGVTLFLRRRFRSNPSSLDKHLGSYAPVQ